MTASEVITAIKDFLMVVAAGIASYVALMGLHTWRKQLTGTAEYELARRVLEVVYKIREAVRSIRKPLFDDDEISNLLSELDIKIDENDQKFDYVRSRLRTVKRWSDYQDLFTDFELVSIEAEALWGQKVKEKLDAIHKTLNSLYLDAELLTQYLYYTEPTRQEKIEMAELRKRLYGIGDENDDFYIHFSTQIKEVEDALKQYLKK